MGGVKKSDQIHKMHMHTAKSFKNRALDLNASLHISASPPSFYIFQPRTNGPWESQRLSGSPLTATGSPSSCPFYSHPGVKPVIFLITVFLYSSRRAAFTFYEGQEFSPHCQLSFPCGLVERLPRPSHFVGIHCWSPRSSGKEFPHPSLKLEKCYRDVFQTTSK